MPPLAACEGSASAAQGAALERRSSAEPRSPTAAALERGRALPFLSCGTVEMQSVFKTAGRTAAKIVRGAVTARLKKGVREGKYPLRTAAEKHAAHKVKSAIPLYGTLAIAGPLDPFAEGYGAAAAAGPFMESPFPTYCRCSTFRPRHILGDEGHRVFRCEECAPKRMGMGEYVRSIEARAHVPRVYPRRTTQKKGASAPSPKSNSKSASRKSKAKSKNTAQLA